MTILSASTLHRRWLRTLRVDPNFKTNSKDEPDTFSVMDTEWEVLWVGANYTFCENGNFRKHEGGTVRQAVKYRDALVRFGRLQTVTTSLKQTFERSVSGKSVAQHKRQKGSASKNASLQGFWKARNALSSN